MTTPVVSVAPGAIVEEALELMVRHRVSGLTTDVVTVDETTSLQEVARMMQRQGIRRLPVTRDRRVVGIVSRRDLAQAIREDRLQTSDRFWESASKKVAEPQDS